MNVFVLTAGRTGSVTFSRACARMTNFSVGHESRAGVLGEKRVWFPDNHIEVDNRLSWFLGRIEERYGAGAFYVHLRRNPEKVAESYAKRIKRLGSIVNGYCRSIYIRLPEDVEPLAVARDYLHTVDTNISAFLRDKPGKMEIWLENVVDQFPIFWREIGAQGDLDAALGDLVVKHNETRSPPAVWADPRRKVKRILRKLPAFIRDA